MRIAALPLLIFAGWMAGLGVSDAQNAPSQNAPSKSGLPIEVRLRNLEGAMAGVKQGIKSIDAKYPAMNKQVKELLEKVYSVQTPPSAKEEKEEPEVKPQPMKVEYRPPLFKLALNSPVLFVCKEERLHVLDLAGLNRAIKAAIAGNNPFTALAAGRTFKLDADYDVLIERPLPRIRFEAVLKANRTGESHDQIKDDSSAFGGYLRKLNPKGDFLQFLVYPDSYGIFRTARSKVWERRFEMEWRPVESGGKLLFQ